MFQLYELIGWRWEQPGSEDLQSPERTAGVFVDRIRARAEAEQQTLVLMLEVSSHVEPSVRAFVEMLSTNPGRLSIIVAGLEEESLRAAGSPLMVEHLADLSQEEVEDGMRRVAGTRPRLGRGHGHRLGRTPSPPSLPAPASDRAITREMQQLLSAAIEDAAEQRRR